jgi:DNA primase
LLKNKSKSLNPHFIMIPNYTLDTINDLSIIEVAKKLGLDVKKNGANYKCNCPFHNENTPSFSLSPGKNMFKCFGCGEGGGTVRLVMLHEKKDWIDAVKWLGKEFHVTIPREQQTEEQKQQNADRENIMLTNELAHKFFLANLTGAAHSYATKRWPAETLTQWGVGFAPDDWHALEQWASKNSIKREALLKAGLLSESNGKVFSFFRNRVMFPIHNRYGRIVAFSGRYIGDDPKQPKYLNSPETPAFSKSNTLYGIFFAHTEIRKRDNIFLVEGNPDVIKMHMVGADNTVAPMGTSLTTEQLAEVKRHTENITFVLETDEPGIKAVIKNAITAIKEGFFVSLLSLPEEFDKSDERIKYDADSFFESRGQFNAYVKEHTESFIIWYANRCLISETNPGNRQKYIKEICELLIHVNDPSTLEDHLVKLTKIDSPKTKWTKGIKAAKDRGEEKDIEKRVKATSSKDLFDKYGFIEENNQIFFSTKNGTVRGANFTLKPLFHVASVTNSKRLYLMRNENGFEEIVELIQEDLIALSKFRKAVESRGNFIWEAGENELIRYKRYLYEQTDTCYEITQLGWQKEGFWAWGNGIFNGAFSPTDSFGIVSHDGKNWYLPAFSKIWEGEKEQFQFERNFIFRSKAEISLNDYAEMFIKVYGNNGIVGLCFLFSAIFRDIVVKTTHNFPILNMFGPKGAGKSEMGISLMSFFAVRNKAPNLNNSTVPAINDAISQSCNSLVHLDEYKNDVDYTKIELLKGIYDGTGRTRMNMDRDKKRETTAVDSAIMVSGQEMPTVDIALFSRLIFVAFHKTIYTKQEKENFEWLKAYDEVGLSHLTHEILSKRDMVKKHWLESYNEVSRIFQDKLKGELIEDRIFRNWIILASTFKTLEPLLRLPFSYSAVESICVEGIKNQNQETKRNNELSNFWNLVEYMVKDGLIENEVDFYVKRVCKLKTDTIDAIWKENKTILIMNHTKIFQLYRKHGKVASEKILPLPTLQYYLMNSKDFLGMKKSQAFKNRDAVTRQISEETDNTGYKKTKYQVTTAYIFDYDSLGISIDYILSSENDGLMISEAQVVDIEEKKDLPF